jgi:mRNA interferase RelE/StbE
VANYKVLIKPTAIKELKKIPKKDLPSITSKIESLSNNPYPPGCEKLAAQDAYSIRQGTYRIIYTIENDDLIVIVV